MADNKDKVIDLDEIDELPDVVLGEETRAMRAIRDGAHTKKSTKKPTSKKSTSKSNQKLDKVDVFEQTTGIPSVDELLKNADPIEDTAALSRTAKRKKIEDTQHISTQVSKKASVKKAVKATKTTDTQPIEISETSSKTVVMLEPTSSTSVVDDEVPEVVNEPKKTTTTKKVETKKVTPKKVVQPKKEETKVEETKPVKTVKKVEEDLDLDSIKQQRYKNGTRVDYLGNEVEIEEFNTKTQRYRIFDAGRTKWVTEKNLKLYDPEIPDSLQDEDPGVKDELSPVLEEKKEEKKEVTKEEKKPIFSKTKQTKNPFDITSKQELKKEKNPFSDNTSQEMEPVKKNTTPFDQFESVENTHPIELTSELNAIYNRKVIEKSNPKTVSTPKTTQSVKSVENTLKPTKQAKKSKKSKTSMFLNADSEKELENTATDQPLLIPHDTVPLDLFEDNSNNGGNSDSKTNTLQQEQPETTKKRKNYVPMKQKIVTGIIIVLLILLGIGIYSIYSGVQPVSSTSEEVAFEVKEGSTARDVADELQEQGIIKNADIAYTFARLYNLTDIKQGLFTLDKSWDVKQMWTYLNDINAAKKDEALVTIIEGDWAKDAASKFAEVTNVSADDLLALWNNQEWINSQREKYPFITDDMFKDGVRIYLEGYLAPNTYYVNKETTAEEITTTLLDQTLAVYNKYADDIANSGHSIAEIYTMASIIQYEAGTNPDDLAKVASVFYNRLNAGMALQSSVTVCYAIDFDKLEDNWQACEINSEFESPYNTYKYTGLTPGPIENAGEEALYAAIHPADTNYYYFMAEVCDGQDGTVHYAETLDEHNANVSQYLTCY